MIKSIHIFLILGVLLCSSCKKQQKKLEEVTIKSDMSTATSHKKVAELSNLAKQNVGDWQEYNDVKEFLSRFNSITPNEALQTSNELKDLAQYLSDSLKIDALKTDALKARSNVFRNEVLRLYDMSHIPAIKAQEVNQQIDKVLLIFSSYTIKINTIYSKEEFDKEINLDDFFKLEEKQPDNSQKKLPKPLELQ
ncbi:hypothetical protein [Tenacibaculum agarivorans]|uniref:hypothetical protein n=1 Tax=Tenacibaculum agarivorans TaxID=1908389 RepID=UPI00094BBF01|nr:hypothetical protein [Tenacibaculum agarivorans]